MPNINTNMFKIQIGGSESIFMKTFKDMVSVLRHGMMVGDFETRRLLARDGETAIEDPNELAKKWQVRQDEPMLFMTPRAPQNPQECMLHKPVQIAKEARRLRKTVTQNMAEKACAHWKENMGGCIHDVIATGDLELAEV